MINVVHNNCGSGDWVEVWKGDDIIFQGSSITPNDLVDILNQFTNWTRMAQKINCDDKAMLEGSWREYLPK
jgi:hypothetical protein